MIMLNSLRSLIKLKSSTYMALVVASLLLAVSVVSNPATARDQCSDIQKRGTNKNRNKTINTKLCMNINKIDTKLQQRERQENSETYILIELNIPLKKMNIPTAVMKKLSVIKTIKIPLIPKDQPKIKTINSQGITRTMYCKPCTQGSPMLQSNRTGIDMGIPKVIPDVISEAIVEIFGGENPLKKSQIIKLGISSYKEMAKTINDPNINKAMAMPAEQLKQIKKQQRKTQANSNDNSGGSAEGHEHDHEDDGQTPILNKPLDKTYDIGAAAAAAAA